MFLQLRLSWSSPPPPPLAEQSPGRSTHTYVHTHRHNTHTNTCKKKNPCYPAALYCRGWDVDLSDECVQPHINDFSPFLASDLPQKLLFFGLFVNDVLVFNAGILKCPKYLMIETVRSEFVE